MEKGGKKLLSSSSAGGGKAATSEPSRTRNSSKGPRIGSAVVAGTSVDASPLELLYLDQDVLQEGLKHSTQLMQQHREEGNARRQRHEQRRRKFLRQLDTTQMNFSNKVFEKEVIGQILNFARCEEEEKEFKNEVLSYKDIMVYNRHNRDKKIEELQEKDQNHNALWESVEAEREIDWVVKLDTKSQLDRRNTLLTATKSANRDEAMSMVTDFISKLLDQVDWTLTCREIGGFGAENSEEKANANGSAQPLPGLLWKDASTMLTANLPFLEPLPNLEPLLPSSVLLPFNISEAPHLAVEQWLLQRPFKGKTILDRKVGDTNVMTSSDFLAKEDWLSFLEKLNSNSAAKFLETHKIESIPVEEKTYSKDEVLTPTWLKSTQSPYFLGEAVVEVRCRVDPLPTEPEKAVDTSAFPLRAVLFGVSDRMREMTVAAAKNLIPRFNIISVESLVKKVFSYYEQPEKDLESDYGKIAQEVFDSLGCGAGITDKLYVKLIIHELKVLAQTKNNGFLINDYPNSREQLLLLMEGFSNIRYDEHRPQRSDKASLLAPLPLDTPELLFDVSKCGLDVVLCVDAMYGGSVDSLMEGSNIDRPLRERVRARKNLVNQETVFISKETTSVVGLQKVYDPKRPMMTCGLDLTIAEQNTQDILTFADKLGLVETMEYANTADIEEMIDSKVKALVEKFIPEEQRLEAYWVEYDAAEAERIRIQKEEEEKAAIAMQEAELEAARQALENTSFGEIISETYVEASEPTQNEPVQVESDETAQLEAKVFPLMTFEKLPAVVEDNVIPIRLAEALSSFWEKNETFSYQNGHDYFSAMRDIRYQFVQRRRIALDSIYTGMIRIDDRQETFNKFRDEFNALDDELRFDPDCIAELHLRTMTLRNRWSVSSEQRLKELKDIIQGITVDGNIAVLQYNGRYESAYFLQSELNRFFHSLQIIFDYAKSIQGFQCCEKIRNELEVLLAISTFDEVEADGGKGKDKGKEKDKKAPPGKDKGGATFQPYREPLAPYFMVNTQAMVAQVPAGKSQVEEVVDPKAKGKPKDKKGGDDGTPIDFFATTETVVQEEINKWKEGTFSISRELHYNRDENLCKAIESAVWYEAEKLSLACEMIKTELLAQNTWLEGSEQSLLSLLNNIAEDRYYRELAAGESLILVIERCIMNSQPLEELWIVSADASPLVDPLTAWDRLKFCIPSEIQAVMDRERQEEAKRRKEEERLRLENKALDNVLNQQQVILDRTEKMLDAARPSTGKGNRKGEDNATEKIGRNPTRGRRDDSAKVRSSLGVSYAAARPASGTTSSNGPSNPTSARPRSAQDSAESKSRELYLRQKMELEGKFQRKRAKREEEYRLMGMSQAAAVLAAHHELFLEEQHQMEDFEAKYRTKRPSSSSRNSAGKRRDGKK